MIYGKLYFLETFVHALIVHRLCSQSPFPHTTGGSSEGSPSPEVCGCRELGSQVQRARLSCADAEIRMRNPHFTYLTYVTSIILHSKSQAWGRTPCVLKRMHGVLGRRVEEIIGAYAPGRCGDFCPGKINIPGVVPGEDIGTCARGRHRDLCPEKISGLMPGEDIGTCARGRYRDVCPGKTSGLVPGEDIGTCARGRYRDLCPGKISGRVTGEDIGTCARGRYYLLLTYYEGYQYDWGGSI